MRASPGEQLTPNHTQFCQQLHRVGCLLHGRVPAEQFHPLSGWGLKTMFFEAAGCGMSFDKGFGPYAGWEDLCSKNV